MNRFRCFAIGSIFVCTLAAPAQQPNVPIVDQQLKVLTAKLVLSSEQQTKIKPILQELHNATQKIVDDKSLSRDERMARARPLFSRVDKQMREMLSEDQKKKLDQYEQAPHPEMHGNLEGPASSASQAPTP